MDLPIRKFGQYVLMQVHDAAGALVFATDSLRIDFDIRHIPGWSRAKFTVMNLAPDTIRKLSNGTNYVTISIALHDSSLQTIASGMYVSNALEEIKVPESVFSMYCYSKLRHQYLETQIDVKVKKPTLDRVVQRITQAAGFSGVIEYKHFPQEVLDYVPPKPISSQRGSLNTCLVKLGHKSYYRFNVYTEEDKIVLMYKPDAKNVESTGLHTESGVLKLNTNNMRANPKIGPATLSVVSNLDPAIKPATILDISNLLTAGTSADEETLQVAEGYLREKVAGFSRYQTLSVQHKGSNWTAEWLTQVMATSPTPGTDMPVGKWWE